MVWFIAIICLIIAVLLFSGRGAFLIAGYNMASKAEKMKYNEKKLCRVIGSGMGIITILIIMLGCFGENTPRWLMIVLPMMIISIVAIVLILCNTICKVENPEVVEDIEEKERQNWKTQKGIFAFVAVVFVIIGVLLVTGEVKVQVEDKNIEIDGSYWEDYKVNIDSIRSISYTENFDTGKRSGGFGSLRLLEGNFRNHEFGNYTLYAYLKCSSYIILDTTSGKVVVNAETSEETRELYEILKNNVE